MIQPEQRVTFTADTKTARTRTNVLVDAQEPACVNTVTSSVGRIQTVLQRLTSRTSRYVRALNDRRQWLCASIACQKTFIDFSIAAKLLILDHIDATGWGKTGGRYYWQLCVITVTLFSSVQKISC